MNARKMLPGLLLLLAMAPLALAQTPALGGEGPDPAIGKSLEARDLEAVLAAEIDGQLWARGGNWKARFGVDGVDFIPFFGADAPRNFPLGFAVPTLTVGGNPRAVDAEVRPTREGERVSFRRGALTEIYDLAMGGIEQSFRLDAFPGDGDIVLEIGLATELQGTETAEGLRFGCDLGFVNYTRAVAVDAAGRRIVLETELVENRIRIRMAAAAAADLRFPVVIDPLVATSQPVTSLSVYNPDLAFELGSERWVLIAENTFSATDHDVYAWIFESDGTFFGMSTIDFTTESWTKPAVACNHLWSNALVAAVTPTAIRSRVLAVQTGAVGTTYDISTSGGTVTNVDVGGDPSVVGPSYYLVVWEREYNANDHDLYHRMVNGNGQPVGLLDIQFEISSWDDRNPSISKTNGSYSPYPQYWAVVWDRDKLSDHDIVGQRVDRVGAFLGPQISVHSSFLDTVHPDVSSPSDPINTQRTWAVAFESASLSVPDVGVTVMIDGARIESHASIGTDFGLVSQVRSRPAIETDGCGFAMVYETSAPIAVGADIAMTSFRYNLSTGVSVLDADLPVASSFNNERAPAIASSSGFAFLQRQMYLAWQSSSVLVGGTSSIATSRYDLIGPGGFSLRLPTATDGLNIEQQGLPSLGQNIVINLTNAVGPAYLVVGLPMLPVTVCGMPIGIDLSQPYLIYSTILIQGTVPCDPIARGYIFAVQGADNAGTGCFGWRVSDVLINEIQ